MRIVWKDTYKANGYKPFKYRGVWVNGYPNGWTTDMPGDNNLYLTRDDAFNAIDKAIGGSGHKGTSSTRKTGLIRIVGTKNETA
jgi:hypothetical protein